MAQDTLTLPVTQTDEFDVVVVGAGITGCCAAIESARSGARTAIVESYGFFGGVSASGIPWLGFHDLGGNLVAKGLIEEMMGRLRADGFAGEYYRDPIAGSAAWVNVGGIRVLLARMISENGVLPYLHSLACGVDRTGARVDAVYIVSKEGCRRLRAKTVVDCTETGDVAIMGGATYEVGRRPDGKVQSSSYMLTVGNLGVRAMIAYFEQNPDQIRPFPMDEAVSSALLRKMKSSDIFIMGGFPRLMAQAKADGLKLPRDRMVGVAFPEFREAFFVTSAIDSVNPNDVAMYSRQETEALLQVSDIMRFIRDYMPGGGEARIVNVGHQVGIRETRHIHGDYFLEADDLVRGTMFDDAVALGGYHLDVHAPGGDLKSERPPTYSIPYRSFIAKGLDNVLVAGRSFSASHYAQSSTRVIPLTGVQGQAAGAAAAMAGCEHDGLTREVDVGKLRAHLVEHGAELGQGIEGFDRSALEGVHAGHHEGG